MPSPSTLPKLPACLPGTSRSSSVPAGLAPDCGYTKAWRHEAAEVWHVWGAVPCPVPLWEVPQVRGVGSDLQTLSIPFPPLPVRTLRQDSTGLFGKQLAQLGCSQGHWGSPKGDSDPQGPPGPEAGWEAGSSRICNWRVVTAELLDLPAVPKWQPVMCVQLAAGCNCCL